jgi:hypothetical protein
VYYLEQPPFFDTRSDDTEMTGPKCPFSVENAIVEHAQNVQKTPPRVLEERRGGVSTERADEAESVLSETSKIPNFAH